MLAAAAIGYMKLFFNLLLFLFLAGPLCAQTYTVSGTVQDDKEATPLIGAAVFIFPVTDTTNKTGVASDENGTFTHTGLANGTYKLRITYTGYSMLEREVNVQGSDVTIGTIKMGVNATILKDVNIVENQVRVEQKGDTTEYNANAYKTNPDANAEDLIKKMPGISSDGGTIKAQGEEIKKVLVDGKEFFGDDANLALKNLPAEVIDKVQVFDRMSDQAQFTRFDDGNSTKAINIVTKNGRNNGVFGKFFASYGYLYDHQYSAGGTINWFKGDRRISLIGMSNNINQQNFSTQDLLGVTGTSQSGGQRGGGRGGFRNSPVNDFLVGSQSGISTTHSAGFNYTDMWGKKVKVTGSYFFNLGSTTNNSDLSRQYFNQGDSSLVYNEANTSLSRNLNHRVNLRMEYDIDSNNKITFTPKFSWQDNEQSRTLNGATYQSEGVLQNSTYSNYFSKNQGYNLSGDLLYQHKFKARGRTFSINMSGGMNQKDGYKDQQSLNAFITEGDSVALDQHSITDYENYTASGNISYTEPIADVGVMEFSYQPSYTTTRNRVMTNNLDSLTNEYSVLDTLLSNSYDFDYMTHSAGIRYRISSEKISAHIGANAQYSLLTGDQVFPYIASTRKEFKNILPTFMFNYKFSATSNIRIFYRTSTNAPTVSQLQSVIDNSNPLLLRSGNPDLKQNYGHFVMVRYGISNPKTTESFFLFASANYTQNYIANATIIAANDTMLNGDVLLRAGSQYTLPVNLKGNLTANTFLTYGRALTKIKSNLNLNAGLSYSLTPGLINSIENMASTYNISAGGGLTSNISEKIDFSVNYTANYSIVRNTIQTTGNNNYFYHTASAKINWNFWKGFVFNTNIQNVLYTGIAQGFNQNYFLWNAELGYKFLKDKSLEVKFGAYDMLNQNNGISRTVTETYVEDTRNTVLKRYVLLTLTYNLRYFKKPKEG